MITSGTILRRVRALLVEDADGRAQERQESELVADAVVARPEFQAFARAVAEAIEEVRRDVNAGPPQ